MGGRRRAGGLRHRAPRATPETITLCHPLEYVEQIRDAVPPDGLVRLDADTAFPVTEALFWDALIHDDWRRRPVIDIYSEGTMDGIPLPLGPAWCAADAPRLERELPHLRFELRVNGQALDLTRYPVARRRLSDGRECAWIGVVSRGQRASQNHFVYTLTPTDGAPPDIRPMRVEATVVFKDP